MKYHKLMKTFVICLFFLYVVCAGAVWAGENKPNPHNPEKYNIILIDITSLRADHLSCYGYVRNTSPYIDRLADEGIWFKQAVSQAYWTLPSVTSVLTSEYVCAHNVDSRQRRLNDSEVSIAEILKENGYKTAAFTGGLDLDSIHNLSQGFDEYFDDTQDQPMGYLSSSFSRALSWLKSEGKSPFFIFIQGYDIHPPFHYRDIYENVYDPDYHGIIDKHELDYPFLKKIQNGSLYLDNKKVKLSAKDIGHIIAHYDGGIRYVDSLLGDFLIEIEKSNFLNNTVIFLFADHGEELLDHGSFKRFENANLYEEVVHVPLIIKHPRIKKVKVERQVELIDIPTTVLGILGLKKYEQMRGEDLLEAINNKTSSDPGKYVYSGWGDKQMVRGDGYKLIFNKGEFELYDLKNDSKEQHNIINKNQQEAVFLAKKLFDWHITNRKIGRFQGVSLSGEEIPEFFRRINKKK